MEYCGATRTLAEEVTSNGRGQSLLQVTAETWCHETSQNIISETWQTKAKPETLNPETL